MSTRNEAVQGRSLGGGIIAAVIAVAAALAGCSSASDAQSTVSYEEQAPAGAPQADGGFDLSETDDANRATTQRALIITGDMYMTVEDPTLAADRAAGIVKSAGGRIDARSETAADGNQRASAWLTMRIPADRLDGVLDDIRKLGEVDSLRTDTFDVTNEVIDLDAKISTLRASTERIERLLADAKGIPEIITLENELSQRQAELESLEARQRGLADQVAMSTINLSLTTEPVVVVIEEEEDDSPKSFLEGLADGWNGLVGFLSAFAIVLGVMLPWLGLFGVLFGIGYGVYRARRAMTDPAETEAMSAQQATPPPPAPKK